MKYDGLEAHVINHKNAGVTVWRGVDISRDAAFYPYRRMNKAELKGAALVPGEGDAVIYHILVAQTVFPVNEIFSPAGQFRMSPPVARDNDMHNPGDEKDSRRDEDCRYKACNE
jgi:hypothetical protein